MNRPLIALAGLVVAGGTAGGALLIASSGGEEEVVQQVETATAAPDATASPTVSTPGAPAPTAPAGATLWRWMNVTLLVPDDGKFYIVQGWDPVGTISPPHVGPVLELYRYSKDGPGYMPSSWVHFDAETGAIVRQQITEENRAEVQMVADTLVVSPLDPLTAPWPYAAELPDHLKRETFGGLSFIVPSPETGITVSGQINDPGGPSVRITNGKSSIGAYIDGATGNLTVNRGNLRPEYEATFQRWVDTVKLCGVEVSC